MAAARRGIIAAAAALVAAVALAPGARGVERGEFPPGFLFGAATSAYQIEGAYLEDGKGLCNWDVFTHTHAGNIMDGRTGDVADDHYHRYMGDVEILQSLGVNAYRFSISWARILPRGRLGGVNPDGISFYNRLIDALLQKVPVLPQLPFHSHFCVPISNKEQAARCDSFFLFISPVTIRDTAVRHTAPFRHAARAGSPIRWLAGRRDPVQFKEEFEHYADVCFRAFGDRVRFWTTFNEPNLFTKFMYMLGAYPPNRCSAPFGSCSSGDSHREPYVAAHNIIMSHAAAVRNYKDNYQAKQGGSIGIVIAMKWYEPLTNTTEDILAARRAQSFELEWFLDPIFFGDYPTEMREILKSNLPTFTAEEKKLLQCKADFIGINHYTAIYAKDCIHSPCSLDTYEGNALVFATGERDGVKIGGDTALGGFYVVPQAVEPAIMYVNQRYKDTPVYISENGYSQWSDASREELINDVKRLNYLQGYVTYLSKAIRNGANVRGYFVWTLLDNFEWTFGYTIRFGLYHVDFDTQERTPRMSARWYRSFLTGSHSAGMADEAQERRADS
ncbi:unnamed protein product [Urochloa decumbens]|uniref:4-hydroxy-7-methoxy-3-oxo-3,4-dihydro-2H-1,4-benzoxazin-2-yl glucosidebeta-D-glucosidase n=1 Tax=Urochloa decumbens TaxID=240449 RepID=A0ABC9CDD9_9POAL